MLHSLISEQNDPCPLSSPAVCHFWALEVAMGTFSGEAAEAQLDWCWKTQMSASFGFLQMMLRLGLPLSDLDAHSVSNTHLNFDNSRAKRGWLESYNCQTSQYLLVPTLCSSRYRVGSESSGFLCRLQSYFFFLLHNYLRVNNLLVCPVSKTRSSWDGCGKALVLHSPWTPSWGSWFQMAPAIQTCPARKDRGLEPGWE